MPILPMLNQAPERIRRSSQAVYERAAERLGMSVEQVAYIVSIWTDEIATEVSKGNQCRTPAFGMWTPMLWKPRRPETPTYCRPAFFASSCFTQQVIYSVLPETVDLGAINSYRRSHWPAQETKHRRVFTGTKKFRRELLVSCRKSGVIDSFSCDIEE